MSAESEREKVLMMIPCFHQQNSTTALGDLIFTDKKLYFVPLQRISHTSMGIIGGTLAGGIIGAALGAMNDADDNRSRYESTVESANMTRRMQYGLSIQERIDCTNMKNLAVNIPRDDIQSFDIRKNNELFCLLSSGQSYQFIANINIQQYPLAVKKIQAYAGDITGFIPVDTTEYGFELTVPKPFQFAESLRKGEYPSAEIITALSNDVRYLDALWTFLSTMPENILAYPALLILNVKIGDRLFECKQLNEADRWYIRAIKIDDQCVDAWVGRGKINRRNQEEYLDHALSINPKSTSALYYKGTVYFSGGFGTRKNLELGLKYFEEVIQLDSGHLMAWVNKCAAHYRFKQFSESIKSCEEALKIDSKIADTWYYKGMSEVKINKTDDAIKSLEACMAAKIKVGLVWQEDYDKIRNQLYHLKGGTFFKAAKR
jgi:tetratricopeptide (TPR) repeat protein